MLDEICRYKKREIKKLPPISVKRQKPVLNILESLRSKPFIMEIKRASPSYGDINLSFDIVRRASDYEKFGAGCISVLTDEKYFKGSLKYLKDVSETVNIPVLCKDFFVDPIQIDYAYVSGADVILIIVAMLDVDEIKSLYRKAAQLGLHILFEVHKLDEFEKIKNLDIELLGVNCRDLKTFKINKENAYSLLQELPATLFKVAESGIENSDDIAFYKKAGADAFLVGTYLMKSDNLQKATEELYKGVNSVY
jgi:indole-3-glycerol phosphate synthase